jgi:hypothetical protein
MLLVPQIDRKRQLSQEGGCQPLWRKDGKEFFYLVLMANCFLWIFTPDLSRARMRRECSPNRAL